MLKLLQGNVLANKVGLKDEKETIFWDIIRIPSGILFYLD